MNTDNLTSDQLSHLKECKSVEDLMGFVKEESIELTDEQLEAVTGGVAQGWNPEQILPEGFDSADVWKNLPLGSTH